MKKIILFIVIILTFISVMIYSTYGKEFLSILDEKKIYKIENIKATEINTLNEFKFFNKGIITYNNQKVVYMDFNNKVLWENENIEFSNRVFITDNYIFRQTDKNITVSDKNNQGFVMAEIYGNIVNVSRENGKTCMIVSENGQTLFIMNDSNVMLVDKKEFKDAITGVSISDKSEAYSIITLAFNNGIPVNTLYFNLADDMELWKVSIEKEILIKTKVVNNNVIAIGTENIYYYNNNGKLMWKNSVYNKILDYEISKENQRIYILFEKDKSAELISYNFDGKVIEILEAPKEVTDLKIVEGKIFVYNKNKIFLLHSNKADKIFEDKENFEEILIEGNSIHILYKNKILKGQIK